MRLSWSDIRARAASFSAKHKEAHRERSETQTFYNDFFDVFGIDRRRVATFEHRVQNLPKAKQGFIDLFWPGTLIVEQKSANLDLKKASDQALDYYDWLPIGLRPRYILTCDFQRWHLLDLEENREWRFKLHELKDRIEAFSFMFGTAPRLNRRQSEVNVKASQLMGQLHTLLANSGYTGHDLEKFLVRLLFILFADDTRIFEENDLFEDFLERRTATDGSDLGHWLGDLFEVLNTPEDQRQTTLDEDLAAFPYINGDLFAERIRMPAFDLAMRTILLDACAFDWSKVSPAIFGGLFESVIDKVTRRRQGAHYTPEDAILKLIGPLFLDDLQAEFARISTLRSGRADALATFHDRIAGLTFLDPACGAGNFLVVTYRELRELERQVIAERFLRAGMDRGNLKPSQLTRLKVDQLYGIEIDEFPARIAQVALWMTDHIANQRLGEMFGENVPSIPLTKTPGIQHGDALEKDWTKVLAPERCSYVVGNPPFVGAKMQSPHQRAQVRDLAKLGGSGGTLDYVAAWFIKGADYAARAQEAASRAPEVAFVATNSICQGEQVAQLWPVLFHRYRMEIAFAHRTFAWPGRAAVHCVIVGLKRAELPQTKTALFSYLDGRGEAKLTSPDFLTAYLFNPNGANRHLVVEKVSRPLTPRPEMVFGNMPNDDGGLILSPTEKAELLRQTPALAPHVRKLLGAKEVVQGGERYCLWLTDAEPNLLRTSATVSERLARIRTYRANSTRNRTNELAESPTHFGEIRHTGQPYVLIPRHSSERRHYVPLLYSDGQDIAHDSCLFVPGASLADFGVLTSAMHMAWLREIGGRLKSDYRYSIGLVYNTFPWPNLIPTQIARLEVLAQDVLDARAMPKNATASLADLYDPDFMPAELRKAHRELDLAVDRLYRAKPFASDRERVEHLFPLYEALVQPTAVAAKANKRTVRRVIREKANIVTE